MKKRFFILDPAIRDNVGHYSLYAQRVATAADSLGFTSWIITHVDATIWDNHLPSFNIVPYFTKHIWEQFEEEQDGRDPEFRTTTAWIENAIHELDGRFRFCSDDFLLWPTVTARHIPGLVAAFTSDKRRIIHTEILIRYQSEWFDHPAVLQSLRILEKTACRIVLSTDSEILSRELGVLTSLPVVVRPIPHVHDEAAGLLLSTPSANDGALVVSMLGNAREEKGFVLLLQALPLIAAVRDGVTPLQFVIQCNDPDQACEQALNDYRDVPGLDVEWIREPISNNDYELRVAQSALVLAPYDPIVYRARTSGIGLDALLHGVPIVTSAGTWLARMLPREAIVEMQSRAVVALASAILEAVGRIKQLTYEARQAQPGVARVHNAVAFVRQVTGATVRTDGVPSSRRAVVIYPWGNATSGRAGASSRLHMLVDYLERNGQSIRVITAGGDCARIGRYTWVEAHDASSWGGAGWPNHFVGATEVLLTWLGGGYNEIKHIVNYIHWRGDYRWRNRLTEAIRWADDVYLEYSFYADIVKSLADKNSTQIWITNHDIVHNSLPQSITKYILQFLELRANRLINLRACVTSTEKNILKLSGIDARHIENVTRTAFGEWVEPNDPHVIVTQLIGRDSRQFDIIMFVGSHYKPNIDAANFIKKIALEANLISDNVCFVVAGGCWVPETATKFVAIGDIDALALHALYSVASIVLNPVQAGSGSAVKMLEAMAHGKCVISTSVGARGHDLHDGVECVIEDDLETFPARVKQWLPSSPEKSAMELRARQRALKNDYMTVFPKYATASNAQWHGAGRRDAPAAGSVTVDYAQLLATPALARDPVIASLVARRGVEAQDLATRLLREQLVAALQSTAVMSRQALQTFQQIPTTILAESLISILLTVSSCNKDNLALVVSALRWPPESAQNLGTHFLSRELRWLLERLGFADLGISERSYCNYS